MKTIILKTLLFREGNINGILCPVCKKGYSKNVPATIKEKIEHGCENDRIYASDPMLFCKIECCVRAYKCLNCKARTVGQLAPEAG